MKFKLVGLVREIDSVSDGTFKIHFGLSLVLYDEAGNELSAPFNYGNFAFMLPKESPFVGKLTVGQTIIL